MSTEHKPPMMVLSLRASRSGLPNRALHSRNSRNVSGNSSISPKRGAHVLKQQPSLGIFLGFRLLRSPALALCICNSLARVRAQYTPPRFRWCLLRLAIRDSGRYAPGSSKQRTYLGQSCNLCIDFGEDTLNRHSTRITHFRCTAYLSPIQL